MLMLVCYFTVLMTDEGANAIKMDVKTKNIGQEVNSMVQKMKEQTAMEQVNGHSHKSKLYETYDLDGTQMALLIIIIIILLCTVCWGGIGCCCYKIQANAVDAAIKKK